MLSPARTVVPLLLIVFALPASVADAADPKGSAKGKMSLSAKGVLGGEKVPVVLEDRTFRVTGRVKPFSAGKRVTVRFYQGGKKVRAASVRVRGAGKRTGRFTVRFKSRRAGRLTVRAFHPRAGKRKGFGTRPLRVAVASPILTRGDRGPLVALVQKRLASLGYAPDPKHGVYGSRTARAVLAFREVNKMPRVETTSSRIVRMLMAGGNRGAFKARFPNRGKHVEADLTRRVVALLDGGRVVRVVHTSHGKRSTPTIRGTFRFYRKHPGKNRVQMVDSNFFIRGYALHGYRFVPTYPDSHGCLRVTNDDIKFIDPWIKVGMTISVYR